MKKICSNCKEEKDIEMFHKRRSLGPNGRKSECKECRNKKHREYAKNNRDKENARIKKWREFNPEKKLAADREWRKNNPDKVKSADRKWKSENREKLSANKSKRRSLLTGVKEDFTDRDREKVFVKFGNRCFACGATQDLTIDHHLPLALGYPLSYNNAVVLCRSCNSSKGVKLPEEFYCTEKLNEIKMLLG